MFFSFIALRMEASVLHCIIWHASYHWVPSPVHIRFFCMKQVVRRFSRIIYFYIKFNSSKGLILVGKMQHESEIAIQNSFLQVSFLTVKSPLSFFPTMYSVYFKKYKKYMKWWSLRVFPCCWDESPKIFSVKKDRFVLAHVSIHN